MLGRQYRKNTVSVDDMINYIKDNCTKYSFSEMAEQLNYSPNYLSMLIAKSTGLSCNSIVRKAKLEKAVMYLSSSDSPIDEIAELCNYKRVSHFFKVFKKHYGVTPAEFRKKSTPPPKKLTIPIQEAV